MRIFNYANLKDYRWDSEILGLVAQIHEFKGKQELYFKQKPAALEKLVEIAKIKVLRLPIRLKVLLRQAPDFSSLLWKRPRQRIGMRKKSWGIGMF